jgi:diguanylate cyclase (GGDEF)-like protein
MDTKPFIEAYQGLNSSYFKLIDSLSAVRALSSIAIQSSSDQELLDKALGVLVENQDLERCSIYLVRDGMLAIAAGMDWADLISVSRSGERSVYPRNTEFSLGEGIVGIAAMSGELQHCRDCSVDQRFLPQAELGREGEQTETIGSILCVPIRGVEGVIGVLNVSHPHAGFFDDGHERTLSIFCNILGQLLVNNRLIHQMDELVQERTRQLQFALSDAEELKQRYEMLSVIDDLTQLHNRRFFFPEARAALARSIRQKEPFAVLLLDVDEFKEVNDNFGHAVGDQVLRQVAIELNSLVREGDILARFGGEEFVLALPNTHHDGAMLLAERIRNRIKQYIWDLPGKNLSITLSIGVSDIAYYAESDTQKLLDLLVVQADKALYYCKNHGRDQVHFYADVADKL